MAKLGNYLKHILVPMVTPFKPDTQDVDLGVAERLADHLITRELCDTLVIAGTTGEFNTLSVQERVELFRVVKSAGGGRVPLVAGTGAASTRETVALTREAENLGYDAVMIVAPYYCRPNQEGIYSHYRAVAEQTGLPIMLYNIPIFTGVNIDPSTVSRLARLPNVAGIKDEAGVNPTQMTDYTHVTPEDFTIYNGDDIMVLCGLAQGASGVISGGSHVIGDRMRKMISLFIQGQVKEAKEIHMALDPLFKSLPPKDGVNPIPGLRAAIELAGIPVGPPRLPLAPVTEEHREAIRQQLARLGVV